MGNETIKPQPRPMQGPFGNPISISFDGSPPASPPLSVHIGPDAPASAFDKPTAPVGNTNISTPPATTNAPAPSGLTAAQWATTSRDFMANSTERLKIGSTGPAVTLYKKLAAEAGIEVDTSSPSTFTAQDAALLTAWQQKNGKQADGKVGDQMWAYLGMRVDVRPGNRFVGAEGAIAGRITPDQAGAYVDNAVNTSTRLRGSPPPADTVVATFAPPPIPARDLQRSADAGRTMEAAVNNGQGGGQGSGTVEGPPAPTGNETLAAYGSPTGNPAEDKRLRDLSLGELNSVMGLVTGPKGRAFLKERLDGLNYKGIDALTKAISDPAFEGLSDEEQVTRLRTALGTDVTLGADAAQSGLSDRAGGRYQANRLRNLATNALPGENLTTEQRQALQTRFDELISTPSFQRLPEEIQQLVLARDTMSGGIDASVQAFLRSGRLESLPDLMKDGKPVLGPDGQPKKALSKELKAFFNQDGYKNLPPKLKAEAAVRALWSPEMTTSLTAVVNSPVFQASDNAMKGLLIHGAESSYVQAKLPTMTNASISASAQRVLNNLLSPQCTLTPKEKAEVAVQLYGIGTLAASELEGLSTPGSGMLEGLNAQQRAERIQGAAVAATLSAGSTF